MKLKTLAVAIMWLIYFQATNLFKPILTNRVALTQLDNTAESFIATQANTQFWIYIAPVLVVVTLLIYRKNISNSIKKLKQKEEK